MGSNTVRDEVVDSFYRVVNKFSYLEKIPRDFGTGDILYPSEIHLIDVIGRSSGINVTEIARKLGITKGAIPKLIRKLERKRLVQRYQHRDNRKDVLCRLTAKGITAFKGHRAYHSSIDSEIDKKINALSERDIGFLRDVFSELDQYADRLSKGI